MLHKRGTLIIPDVIANAGGVISSYAEYVGENPQHILEMVEEKITRSVSLVLERAKAERVQPREAALKIAQKRVKAAMERRQSAKV